MNLAQLRAFGFDNSAHIPFSKQYRVECSCCEAAVINGHPAHEQRCPNAVKECNGCSALVPVNQRYCEDCI